MAEPACPCGSGLAFAACCGALHAGAPAATAEALMRARYAAYVRGNAAYLRATWMAATCPADLSLHTEWLGLSILHGDGGGAQDDEGTVEFVAAFRDGGRVIGLHETSRFARVDGCWRYVDGKVRFEAFGRNAPCPCGSGRKLKHCCAGPARLGIS